MPLPCLVDRVEKDRLHEGLGDALRVALYRLLQIGHHIVHQATICDGDVDLLHLRAVLLIEGLQSRIGLLRHPVHTTLQRCRGLIHQTSGNIIGLESLKLSLGDRTLDGEDLVDLSAEVIKGATRMLRG